MSDTIDLTSHLKSLCSEPPAPDAPIVEWACWAVRNFPGWRVLFLQPGKKEPLSGESWTVTATSDEDEIRRRFEIEPTMNYGLTPDGNGVVIDIDHKPNKDGLQEIQAAFGYDSLPLFLLSETFSTATISGGYHLYYTKGDDVLHGYINAVGTRTKEDHSRDTWCGRAGLSWLRGGAWVPG